MNICRESGVMSAESEQTSAESGHKQRSAHVIVLGNEKGGSGKSTVAMHVAVALMQSGQSVATIDLDARQQSFTRYIENRRAWAKQSGRDIEIPTHFCIARAEGPQVADNEMTEFSALANAVDAVEGTHDFVVIDTPGTDSYLMRLAHSMADVLITPLNDSFVDFDVLGTIDAETFAVTGISHFAELVQDARRHRRVVDHATIDWIVLRNRLSTLGSRNKRLVGEGLHELARRLGFRSIDGISERVIFRELFPRGLTVLDTLEEAAFDSRPNASHAGAREEVEALVAALRLPIDERKHQRAAARAEWFAAAQNPLELHDILA